MPKKTNRVNATDKPATQKELLKLQSEIKRLKALVRKNDKLLLSLLRKLS
jgi:hypothetical protein